MLIRPWTGARGSRPTRQVVLNGQSPQFKGLTFALPLMGSNAESIRKRALLTVGSANKFVGDPLGGLVLDLPGNIATGFLQFDATAYALTDPSTSDYTFATWMRLRTASNCWGIMLQDLGAGAKGLGLGYRASDTFFKVEGYGGSSAPNLASTTVAAVNTWYHLCFTRRGTTNSICVNGRVEATNTTTPQSFTPNTIEIGRFDSSYDPLDGFLADCRIYARALSASEVWALYDPATRWDLYWVPSSRVFFDVGGGGGGTFNPAWAVGASRLLSGGLPA